MAALEESFNLLENRFMSEAERQFRRTRKMKREEVERIMGKEWMEEGKGVLTWREGNRRKLAYSVCG